MSDNKKIIEWFDAEVKRNHLLESITKFLEASNYKVNPHDNLIQSEIDELKNEKVDLIITEIGFGDAVAGIYLLEQLCQADSVNRETPILIYTSVSDLEANMKAEKYVRKDNILYKPAENELQMAICKILQG